MKIIKNLFKPRPQVKYIFLCKRCDIFFERVGFYNRCPICGENGWVYKTQTIQEKD